MKLDHLKLIGKFEFSCALWTIKLSLNFFLELIGAQLDPTFKTESVPHNLFQASKQSSMSPFPDLADFSEMA
jgi:hypothetical protein